jgi:FkbM family methyltransferase
VNDATQSEKLFAGYRQQRVHGIKTAAVRFDGAVYFVPWYGVHRPVAASILRKKYSTPGLHALVETLMTARPGNMVHAGTFFGDMLPSFARKTPGLVYAFEPVLENYLLARRITERNQLDNVLLFHAGLAERSRPGVVETREEQQHRGGGSFVVSDPERQTFATQRVSLISIDQMAIEDVSLIQLDVEGFERPVLEGALETITRHEPVIVLEDFRRTCAVLLDELGYHHVAKAGPRDDVYMTDAWRTALPQVLADFGTVEVS